MASEALMNLVREADSATASRIKAEAMSGDNEADHNVADRLLCELLVKLGCKKTVAAWKKVGRWYG